MRRSTVLIVLDGWGIGRRDYSNPIFVLKPKNIEYLKTRYHFGALQSSGIAVGLPWEEEGNSEVGHLSMGAGKILYQHYPRITISIEKGEFFKNPVLLKAFDRARANKAAVNLVGLLTAGNVHASLEHLHALIKLTKQSQVPQLNLHLFSDGRDSPPRSVMSLLEKVNGFINETGLGTIASLSGRYYALDRDEHWERTQKVYATLTGQLPPRERWQEIITDHYERGLSDEFIEPMAIAPLAHAIKDTDTVVFFDFREDSIRQIASSFIIKSFDKFPTQKMPNLQVVTMTNYSDKFDVPVASPSDTIENPLGKILADQGKLQFRIAETEKYAHVTYFFNGYRDKPFPNEYRVLIPSKNIPKHDEAPEMMTREIAARVIEAVSEGGFDFILANFANPDMIAHTGNYDAALQAIAVVDEQLGKIAKICLEKQVPLLITSDHGNIERMLDPFTGRPETKHDPNLVPCYLIGKEFERPKREAEVDEIERAAIGILSDVAPTVLALMDLPKPPEMTAQSLLKVLR